MATVIAPAGSDGKRTTEAPRPAGPPSRVDRRRQLPLVVVGVLLVVGSALVFAVASLRLGAKQQVLVVVKPVAAGQAVEAADLRAVRVSAGPGMEAIPVGEEAQVVGRTAAVPLVAGATLTRAELGSSSGVASGTDVVAVGLKPGLYPPSLSAGDRVAVVPVSSASGAVSAAGGPVDAVVVGVQAASATSDTPAVFSLQVPKADAAEVASLAAASEASLIQVGG